MVNKCPRLTEVDITVGNYGEELEARVAEMVRAAGHRDRLEFKISPENDESDIEWDDGDDEKW